MHDLFGFKLDVREGGRVRLTSQFAPTPDSHLVFEPEGATGQLRLLGGTGEAGAWDANPTIKSSAEFWISGRHVRRSSAEMADLTVHTGLPIHAHARSIRSAHRRREAAGLDERLSSDPDAR